MSEARNALVVVIAFLLIIALVDAGIDAATFRGETKARLNAAERRIQEPSEQLQVLQKAVANEN